MSTFLRKHIIILSLLSVVTLAKGQVFSLADSIPTNISEIKFGFLPVQSDNGFNFLYYSEEKEKKDFELLTVKEAPISKMKIKNIGLDGGGDWYMSAAMSNEILLLLHVDGYLVVYEKNEKGKYLIKKTLNVGGGNYSAISLLDNENVLLVNDYNYYTKKNYIMIMHYLY